jgi:hypothetical protein
MSDSPSRPQYYPAAGAGVALEPLTSSRFYLWVADIDEAGLGNVVRGTPQNNEMHLTSGRSHDRPPARR